MKIIFIRHGEPDKSVVDARGFIGQGRDLAPLTELGRQQAAQAADSPLLKSCQLIVASPYTRALQTAAIISRKTGLDLLVETDLHEFTPDKAFQVRGEEENKRCTRISCTAGASTHRAKPANGRPSSKLSPAQSPCWTNTPRSAMRRSPSWPMAA